MKLATRLSLLALALFGIKALAFGADEPLETVEHVDLARYQGKWFEVARLPLRWEDKCASDVTAIYTPQFNGKIEVVNTCKKADGKVSQSKGTAKTASKKDLSNAKLKVTFFWPFSGDYWILDLDPDYRWALVGNPNRKNLWILSRTPSLDRGDVDRLLAKGKALGFNTTKIIMTKQTQF
ncbi:MAG TPA: lipocalin family protein [Edaphobacter sp.]|nr:lipocalin family protein [Edaphobacter sp.]